MLVFVLCGTVCYILVHNLQQVAVAAKSSAVDLSTAFSFLIFLYYYTFCATNGQIAQQQQTLSILCHCSN
jgi:hypothetical protein